MKKRTSLKKTLLCSIIIFVAVIIVVITQISIKLQADTTEDLLYNILVRESVTYSNEVHNWWSGIEGRVRQTADVMKNTPEMSSEDTLAMLLKLTELDPDSQDIYIAYGDRSEFLDGSGWIPGDDFVFTDRPWYQGALEKKGEIYSSEPYVDASTGKTCLACAIMLRDDVVLSSDINFDKVAEKVNQFKSVSPDAKYYIINKETKDILVSNVASSVGETLANTTDPVAAGLAPVFDSMDTTVSTDGNRIKRARSAAGSMLYVATDIEGTSWAVVSAVPSSLLSNSIIRVMIITFASAIILLLILSALIYYIISKAINPVVTATERITDISKGDFTVRLVPEGNNEITTLSESLNEYIEKMSQTLNSLSDISGSMNSRAGECFEISRVLSDASSNQGESIAQLNSTLGSMSDSIEDLAHTAVDLADTSGNLAQSAEEVRCLCEETIDASVKGKEEMDSMTNSVNTLNETIAELTDLIRVTAQSVKEITGITDTISAITKQTNLLSLNASIEAARAGEAGRGFAVVAQEVSELSRQSSGATENIRRLVDDITKNIANINSKADICVRDMKSCLSGVDGANESFNKISEDVAKAAEGIMEIADGIRRINDVATNNAATTQEQASGINEILSLSDRIVNENGKLRNETQNITSVSENLNRYSDEINSDLSQYTVK